MEIERYIMVYGIMERNNYIKLLGEEFVKNNRNKGKIIHKNKIYPLQEFFYIYDNKNDHLKIKMILNKNCCNKSCMFKDCSSLKFFKFDNNSYNIEDILYRYENDLYMTFTKIKKIIVLIIIKINMLQ